MDKSTNRKYPVHVPQVEAECKRIDDMDLDLSLNGGIEYDVIEFQMKSGTNLSICRQVFNNTS